MNNQEILRRTICVVRAVNYRTSSVTVTLITANKIINVSCATGSLVVRNQTVSLDKQELIKSLLLERISLRGICRVLKVSLSWLINFIEQRYLSTPEDLQFVAPSAAEIELFCVEADELWSFVEKRENKRWIWLISNVGRGKLSPSTSATVRRNRQLLYGRRFL